MNKTITGLFLLVAAAGLAYFVLVYDSQTNRIKKQFEFIATTLEKLPGESPIVSGAKAKKITEAVADPCLIHIPSQAVSRRIDSADLSSAVLAMRARYEDLVVAFHDYSFEALEEDTAQVRATAGMTARLKSGEAVEDVHEVACRLEKIEGEWKFSAIEFVEVLKP